MTAASSVSVSDARSSTLFAGLHALRWVVLAFACLDLVALVLPYLGVQELGATKPTAWLQTPLAILTVAAFLWRRHRWAAALTALTVLLVFTVGPGGSEAWVAIVSSVMMAATLPLRWLMLVIFGEVAYAIGLGLLLHDVRGTRDAALIVAIALTVGLIARWGLRLKERADARLAALAAENAEIRERERTRLAGELRSVVTGTLDRIDSRITEAEAEGGDGERLRADLDSIDADCRHALTELRALLTILRSTAAAAGVERVVRRRTGLTRVRRGALILLSAAAALLLIGTALAYSPARLILLLGTLALLLAFLRPAWGWVCSVLTISLALPLDPAGLAHLLAIGLCLTLFTAWCGQRRIWLALLVASCLVGVVAVTDHLEPTTHAIWVGIVAVSAVALGLALQPFRDDRKSSLAHLATLESEQTRIASDERGAVARELHDVVAHQLSLTTMLIMSTSLSTDPEKLRATLLEVRKATTAARTELTELLRSMGAPSETAEADNTLTSPESTAQQLAGHLAGQGFRSVIDVDPVSEALDPTTRRTLIRVMQEATTNILRYGDTREPSHYLLSCLPDEVSLTISSPMPLQAARRSDLSMGYGLRGLRERVDLTRGTFRAEPGEGRWQVSVTLPRATAEPGPAAQPLNRARTASP